MERNEFTGIIVYIVMLALAWVVGQTVIAFASNNLVETNMITYVLICVSVSLVLFALIYELGHVIGAKRGKYQIKLVNLFGFCFQKIDNQWKFSFKSPEGLITETRFAPKSIDANPKKFLWGGVLAYFASVLVAMSLFFIRSLSPHIQYGAMIYVAVGLILVFYNIIPLPLDTLNDGYRLKLLGDKSNMEAYNEFMRIEDDILKGGTANHVKVYENVSPMTVLINMFAYYEMLDLEKRIEAEALIDMMLGQKEKLDPSSYHRLLAQKLYFIIYNLPLEEAKTYYWKVINDRERRAIANDGYLPTKRTYLLISGIINESASECRIALENYKKLLSKTTDKTKKRVEEKLFNEAIDKVKNVLKEADFADLL